MNKERLLTLANHLKYGKLGHEKFDFSIYNNATAKCGTMGCALGECPIIWPEDWKFYKNYDGDPVLIGEYPPSSLISAIRWFNLSPGEAVYLFIPCCIYSTRGESLPATATKEEVADRILDFIKD